MNHNSLVRVPRWVTHLVPLALVVAMLSMVCAASAQNIVRVEEDWELVVGQPDANVCGPQIATTMSPFNDINSTYFTSEINHRSAPYWTAGGLTIHQWNGEQRIQSFDRADRAVMNTASEVVTWTQYMYLENGNRLVFEVQNGASTTWGPFGYSGLFKVKANWNQTHINGYNPALSIAQSGVTFAGNRVQSLKIKEIRLTLDDGTTFTDNTEHVAHQLLQ
jgi:hypothetical protein